MKQLDSVEKWLNADDYRLSYDPNNDTGFSCPEITEELVAAETKEYLKR